MGATKPNIVLLSIDSLRGDHCGHLDPHRALTPTLDRLAREGVVFESAWTPGPQTFSSMPAVFTGQDRPPESLDEYPGETHWERRLSAIEAHMTRRTPLPERMRRMGYTTAAVSPNPWTSRATRFDRGFDHFVDCTNETGESTLDRLFDLVPGVDSDSRAVTLLVDAFTGSSFFMRWETLYEEVRQVRESLSEPYFLWVFVLDTHYPFHTSRHNREEQSLLGMYRSTYRSGSAMRGSGEAEELDHSVRRSLERSYRDTVRAVDRFLWELTDEFASDEPVFVIHSDHGESFGEHDNYGHHHRAVYEENIHVPYVIHNADRRDTVRQPISTRTIHDIVQEIAQRGTFDPSAHTGRLIAARSECGNKRAARDERYKYVDLDGSEALFDLERDSEEQTNIAESQPERFRHLRSWAQRHDEHAIEVTRIDAAVEQVRTRAER